MGCGCKNDKQNVNSTIKSEEPKDKGVLFNNIIQYSLKTIAFFITLLLLPIINIFIIKFIFETLILNKKIDVTNMLSFITNKIKTKDEDDEDEELGEDEVEYELQNVEVIK